jgi:hypothetical protein
MLGEAWPTVPAGTRRPTGVLTVAPRPLRDGSSYSLYVACSISGRAMITFFALAILRRRVQFDSRLTGDN